MSVYHKENPTFLEEAFESIWNQTFQTDDFVLVCDGPLTNELDEVIEKHQSTHNSIFHTIRLSEQKGLGNALSIGILACKNEFILRADSDDISFPVRAEKEIENLENNNVDVLSSTVLLFSGSISNINGKRKLPSMNQEIIDFAKYRSPFNHPSVAFRKSIVLKAGNYQPLIYKEDYFLWIRMIQLGARCMNIDEPLVFMRSDDKTLKRRKNKDSFESQKKLLKYMGKTHFIGPLVYYKNGFMYWVQYIAPNWLVRYYYNKHLHK